MASCARSASCSITAASHALHANSSPPACSTSTSRPANSRARSCTRSTQCPPHGRRSRAARPAKRSSRPGASAAAMWANSRSPKLCRSKAPKTMRGGIFEAVRFDRKRYDPGCTGRCPCSRKPNFDFAGRAPAAMTGIKQWGMPVTLSCYDRAALAMPARNNREGHMQKLRRIEPGAAWRIPPAEAGVAPVAAWRTWLARADVLEMQAVRHSAGLTRRRWIRSLALAVNLLGNGWIYLPLAALLLHALARPWQVIGVAGLAVAICHALYAPIKRGCARLRPFEKNPELTGLARVMDRYSFPSGHCMTLTAVLVPVVHALPAMWPFAAAAVGLLAWCRLAAAHHYPSDVAAGIVFGMAVSLPCTSWLLAA
ncbi:phosphatase PAP2 family protein [Oxalobacteraceae bacterium OM1]|nr:phosphatase PAP2 family protein [Oxalobacteraceae bacterium OM1]